MSENGGQRVVLGAAADNGSPRSGNRSGAGRFWLWLRQLLGFKGADSSLRHTLEEIIEEIGEGESEDEANGRISEDEKAMLASTAPLRSRWVPSWPNTASPARRASSSHRGSASRHKGSRAITAISKWILPGSSLMLGRGRAHSGRSAGFDLAGPLDFFRALVLIPPSPFARSRAS